MKKQVSVLLIAAVVLTAVFVAGCTTQTASPTPSPSAAPSTGTATTATASVKPVEATALPNSTDLSSFFTSSWQGQGSTVMTPFNKSVSNTTGNDVYTGTVTDGKYITSSYKSLNRQQTPQTCSIRP